MPTERYIEYTKPYCHGELSDLREFEEWLQYSNPKIYAEYTKWDLDHRMDFFRWYLRKQNELSKKIFGTT